MDFETAFDRLISHEGGFTDNRNDPGNWTGGRVGSGRLLGTKFGIAANTYPQLDIRNLTREQAKRIYRRDWWDRLMIDSLPDEIRFAVFDAAVNSGPVRAAQWLQRAVQVPADGIIGPVTVAAVARASDHSALAARMLGHRLAFMSDLPAWPSFGRGWARRIADNLAQIGAA